MGHIGSRLFGFLYGESGVCTETILLKMLALRLLSSHRHAESVIEALSVQDALGVLSKLVTKKRTLLILVLLSHMTGLVHVRGSSAIESPIVLVDFILRCGFSSMETSLVGSEVGILTRASVDSVAPRHSGLRLYSSIFNSTNFVHMGIIQTINIVEGLICSCESTSVGRLATG